MFYIHINTVVWTTVLFLGILAVGFLLYVYLKRRVDGTHQTTEDGYQVKYITQPRQSTLNECRPSDNDQSMILPARAIGDKASLAQRRVQSVLLGAQDQQPNALPPITYNGVFNGKIFE